MKVKKHIRPGTYIDFKSEVIGTFEIGGRGTALMPLVVNWGQDGQIVELDVNDIVGGGYKNKIGDTDTLPIELALKGCDKVLLYKINKGEKAKTTINDTLTVTALHGGEYGNNISVGIKSNKVTTQVEGVLVDEQEVDDYNELINNSWVSFEGDGKPSDSAFTMLTGGTTQNNSHNNFEDFFKKALEEEWQTLACIYKEMNEDTINFVKNLRDSEEIKVQAVMVKDAVDYEGIIKLKEQTVLMENIEIKPELLTAYVAGCTAGAGLKESLTNKATPFTKILNPMKKTEIEQGILSGFLLFTYDEERRVKIEKDINSLTTTTNEKGKGFRNNQLIRIIDSIHKGIKTTSNKYYIGKMGNSLLDRMTFKSALVSFLDSLQNSQIIDDFNANDLNVLQGEDPESIKVNFRIKPVINIDKIEMEVILR